MSVSGNFHSHYSHKRAAGTHRRGLWEEPTDGLYYSEKTKIS
jgi:hypothetical protein